MHKLFIFLFLSSLFLNANEKITFEKLQILASSVEVSEDILIAKGDVVIYSKNYYITANKIIYNKKLETFELFDNVLIIKDNNIKSQSNYAFLDIKNDKLIQNPSFILDTKSKIWIDTNNIIKENNKFSFGSAVISSCDCLNPMWSLRFSSGSFDINKEWIHAFNARLYIKSVPILYTPYFGFPTDTTRRTGLLKPTIGVSKGEGLTYFQPIFIAPKDNYDIELIPQYKELRGKGMYAYYRYADSQDSILKIKAGIFKENESYFIEEKLQNREHYGVDIDYSRKNLFTKNSEYRDGLFASLTYLNDIEYITLEGPKYNTSTDKKIESKINYYFDTPSIFFGSYLRYYLDRSYDSTTNDIINNNETIQQLPQIQVHKYLDSLLIDNLTYSMDAKSTNFTREKNLNATVNEFSLPISLDFSLFNDYLNLEIKNEIYLNKTFYSNVSNPYEDAFFAENRQSIILSSDLLRPYSSFIHTINISSQFNFVDNLKKEGDTYNSKLDSDLSATASQKARNDLLSPFSVVESQKSASFSLNQSFYSQKDLKQLVNHKITQNITYDENDKSTLGNLENEITINHSYGSLYNRLLYSNEDDKLIENSSSLKFDFSSVKLNLGHYKSVETANSGKEDLESSTLELKYKINRKYYASYSQNYNIEENFKSKESFLIGLIEDCWAFSLKFENEIVASSGQNEAFRQNIIYFSLELIPIGAVNQQYKIND